MEEKEWPKIEVVFSASIFSRDKRICYDCAFIEICGAIGAIAKAGFEMSCERLDFQITRCDWFKAREDD